VQLVLDTLMVEVTPADPVADIDWAYSIKQLRANDGAALTLHVCAQALCGTTNAKSSATKTGIFLLRFIY